MAQTIKLRRSAVAGNRPTTGQLDLGELAINTVDGKIYFERSASAVETVQEIFTTNTQNSGSLNTIGNVIITGSLQMRGDTIQTGSLIVSANNIPVSSESIQTVYSVSANGSSNYVIDGNSNPTLTLVRGLTYTFNVNASGHPFWIKTVATTGTDNQYNDGVTNNGTQSGTITFVVANNAPSTLYYICQYHGGMVGTINVVDGIYTTGEITFIGTTSVTGSLKVSGSLNIVGDETITGSLYVNNTISGSISGIGNVTSYSTSVDSRLSNLQTKSASVDISISNINSFTSSENTKNSTLATYTGSIDTKFSTLGSYTASVDTKFSTLGSYTASVDNKWNTLQNVTSSQQISIDALNVVSGSNLGRLSNLESTSASVNISVTALNTSTASQQISIDALNVVSSSNLSRLTNLESTSASVNNSVTALNSSSASQQISIDALNITSASLNTYTASASGRLTNIELTSASVNISIAALNSSSASQQISIDALNITSASLNEFTASTSTRLSNIETTSASVNNSVTALNTSSASQQISIDALNVVSSSNLGRLTNLENTSASVNISVTNLNIVSSSNLGRLTNLETTSASVNTSVTNLNIVSASVLSSLGDIQNYTSSLRTAFTASGVNVTFNGDTTIKGNLFVQGTQTVVDSTTINLADNILVLNAAGTSDGGLIVRDATGASTTSGSLLWDVTYDYWKAGKVGSESPILLAGGGDVISGSSQLTSSYDNRYVISGSITQTTWNNIASKPDGIVSGSSQLTASYDTRYTISGSVQPLPSNLISSSAQITAFGFVSSSVVIPTGTISGSSQLTSSYDTRYTLSGSVVSGTTPTGTISGSSQLEGTTIQNLSGSFTGSFKGDGSNLTGVIAAGSGVVIASGSSILGTAGQLNFTGSGVSVTLNSGTASISITGGSGGSNTNSQNAILNQTSAAVTWSFSHNLSTLYPVFTIYDNEDNVIIPEKIHAETTSSAFIYFSSARSGTAVASKGGDITSASFAATASLANFATSASLAQSASYILYSNVENKPTLVSGSSQVDITSTTGYSTFSSSIATSISASNVNITSLSSSVYTSDNTQNGRLSNLETKSASVDISVSNINSFTSSTSPRLTNLESKSASVDISISNINSYTSSLKTAISLNGQDVTINGNLNVAGTTTTLNSTTLNIGDNIIELNYGGTAVKSGIYTKDATGGSLVSGSILWDATNDYWVAGISGSESKILRADSDGVISGSAQVIGILTSLNSFTASNDITSLNSATSSYETKGRGIISGSAQLPSGIVSSSAQTILNLPTGTISGSSQLTSSYDTRYVVSGSITQTTWDNIASKPAGIVSGSSQVVGILSSLNSFTSSYATTGSNNFIGTQTFTGSVSISGSLILDNANIDTSRYLHSQSAASTTWTVNHSLEYDYPSVTIYDNTNKVIIPDEITRISNNQLTITFASAESGNAHVSVGGISNLAGDRYLYTQSTPASTWTITHALNYKYVNVDVYDNNDQLMLPQTVTATNNNTLTLVFAVPTSGNATISKGGAKILNGLNDLGNGSYQFTGSLVVTGEVDAQNFNTTSDISLKTNLELIENSLDKVEKLNGYTFDWVENYNASGVKQIGMIAQEVYTVQPELVTKKEILIGNTYEEVMLLDYSKVTSLLIGAVKELSEKVKQLENKIGQ